MKTKMLVTTALLVAAGMSAGCASKTKRPVYDPSQTGTMLQVVKAQIVAVRDVDIKVTTIPTGSTGPVGAVTGGVVQSVITGSANAVGRAVVAVVGGAVGAEADVVVGEEITLALEGGRTVIVVQERSNPPLAEGENVLVVTPSGGMPPIYGGRTGVLGTSSIRGGATKVIREDRFAAANPF